MNIMDDLEPITTYCYRNPVTFGEHSAIFSPSSVGAWHSAKKFLDSPKQDRPNATPLHPIDKTNLILVSRLSTKSLPRTSIVFPQEHPMFNFLDSEASSSTPQQIARSFRWLGWIGLALQSFLGFIPILVVIANVLSKPGQQTGGVTGSLFLAIACLVILFFSIYWCFRYTQIANRLENPDRRPAKAQVIRDVKWGLIANIGIMTIAVIVALLRVGELTFTMLRLPQGATVITANQVGSTVAQGAMISPSNMIAVQAMVNAIAAGLVGTVVALLLLYQIGSHRNSD